MPATARFECDGEVAHGIVELYEAMAYDTAAAGRGGMSLLD